MNALRIKPGKGWFVLKFDDIYNGQHFGGCVAYKVPVECWVYQTGVGNTAMPFGYIRGTFEADLNELVRDGDCEPLAELAYDAIISPSGKVYRPLAPPVNSVDEWVEELCPKKSKMVMEVIEKRRGEPKSEAESRTLRSIPF